MEYPEPLSQLRRLDVIGPLMCASFAKPRMCRSRWNATEDLDQTWARKDVSCAPDSCRSWCTAEIFSHVPFADIRYVAHVWPE
jgi:hypothetical protein